TASREQDEHAALLAAGFATTITKPLPADAWLAAIRRVLEPGDGDGDVDDAAHRVRQPAAGYHLPVWDDAQALSALAGSAANVSAMRGLFIAELAGARDAVDAAAATGDAGMLRATLHRLEAGCGFVGAARLATAVSRLRAAPDSG